MKFHHIGIATKDIAREIERLKKYLKIESIGEQVYDANQDANLCMLILENGLNLELVSGKVVEKLIKKRQFLYHTCYSVTNINDSIKELIEDGAFLVKEPTNAILFGNRKVAFLLWDLGLIELLEDKS